MSDIEAFEALAKEVPVELLRDSPDRYDPLDTEEQGSWRQVLADGIPVAWVWTDWQDGFGVIPLRSGKVADDLNKYLVNAKSLDVPAGWAYTTLGSYVKRFKENSVEISSEERTGELSGVLKDAGLREEGSEDGS